jgi:hypothetical protein
MPRSYRCTPQVPTEVVKGYEALATPPGVNVEFDQSGRSRHCSRRCRQRAYRLRRHQAQQATLAALAVTALRRQRQLVAQTVYPACEERYLGESTPGRVDDGREYVRFKPAMAATFGMHVRFTARPGQGDALAALLMELQEGLRSRKPADSIS